MQKIRTELGKRIRQLRKEHGWSQENLGERARLHPTYIGGIERGERNFSFDNLHRLAKAFGMSLPQLLDFPVGRSTRTDVLRARVIGLLSSTTHQELEFLVTVVESLDKLRKNVEDQ